MSTNAVPLMDEIGRGRGALVDIYLFYYPKTTNNCHLIVKDNEIRESERVRRGE